MFTEKWNKLIRSLEIIQEEDQEIFSKSALLATEEAQKIGSLPSRFDFEYIVGDALSFKSSSLASLSV